MNNIHGVTPVRSKSEAISKISRPENVNDLHSVLGSFQYLSRFIQKLSAKTASRRELLKEGNPCEKDFQLYLHEISESPVLCHFDPGWKLRVGFDAAGDGLGVVLEQLQPDNKFHPVCYASRFLSGLEKNYSH